MHKAGLWAVTMGVMVLLFGAGYGVWRGVSSVHIAQTASSSPPTSSPAPSSVDPGAPLGGKLAPDFTLTSQFGHTVSLRSLRGHVVVLAFINSQGNTVSPLMAVVLRNVLYDLGSHKNAIRIVAINANPVMTSSHTVYQWSQAHHMLHAWTFLTGSVSQLKNVWHQYFMQTTVIHGPLIEHTPGIFVIGPRGHEHWVYLNSPSTSAPAIGAQVHNILVHVVSLLPPHPAVTIPPARELAYYATAIGPSSAMNRSFQLPAIMPGGKTGTVAVGNGSPLRLLEFFATWCPDCQEEMPALSRLEQWDATHDRYPQVVAVDLRMSESSTSHVVQYAHKLKLSFPVALDNHGKIADMYGVSGIPTQVLVSSSGHILWYHQGLIPWAALVQALHQHLPAASAS